MASAKHSKESGRSEPNSKVACISLVETQTFLRLASVESKPRPIQTASIRSPQRQAIKSFHVLEINLNQIGPFCDLHRQPGHCDHLPAVPRSRSIYKFSSNSAVRIPRASVMSLAYPSSPWSALFMFSSISASSTLFARLPRKDAC